MLQYYHVYLFVKTQFTTQKSSFEFTDMKECVKYLCDFNSQISTTVRLQPKLLPTMTTTTGQDTTGQNTLIAYFQYTTL